MNANYDENLLLGYVENELSDSDRATVERWMRDDPRLASLLKAMSNDRQAVRDFPEPAAPPWLMDDVDRGLERTMLIEAPVDDISTLDIEQQHNTRRIFFGLAAAASVLIAGGVVAWSVIGPNNERVAFHPHRDRNEVAMDTRSDDVEPDPGEVDTTPTVVVGKDAEVMGKSSPPSVSDDPINDAVSLESDLPPSKAGPIAGASQRNQTISRAEALEQLTVDNAANAEPVSIVVQTRDVNRSFEQLNFVANKIDRALIEPYDYNGDPWPYAPNDDTPTPNQVAEVARQAAQVQQELADAVQQTSQQPQVFNAGIMAHRTSYTFNLILPADQVDNAVNLLANSETGAKIDYQDVNLNKFGQAKRYESLANARRNWPRQMPDYGDILRQQLPLQPADEAEPSAEQVVIPVIIEAQLTDGAGETQNQAEPTPQQGQQVQQNDAATN